MEHPRNHLDALLLLVELHGFHDILLLNEKEDPEDSVQRFLRDDVGLLTLLNLLRAL